MSRLPSFSFKGSSLSSPEEAFWTWGNIVSSLFDVTLPEEDCVDTFKVEIESFHLGPLLLGKVVSSAQRFNRDPATIARSGVDHYLVQLYTKGGYVGQAEERVMHVCPGDISILDLSRTVRTSAENFQNFTLVLPRPVLEAHLKNPDGLHGQVLPGTSGLGNLLANYITTLHRTAGSLSVSDGDSILTATTSLVAGCFGPLADAQAGGSTATKGSLTVRIKRYIEGNLSDPALSVEHVAQRFHISRATLSRMFGSMGGLAGYIRERRMLRCFAEITSPTHLSRSIGEIAYSWGFSNEPAFSRAFRRMFDMSPRQARSGSASVQRAAQYGSLNKGATATSVLEEWIRHLRG